MQTFKDDAPLEFIEGDSKDLADIAHEKLLHDEIDRAVIGKMPTVGSEVELSGFKFKVQTITANGNVVLEPQRKR